MDVVASIIELKSNSLDRVEAWATTLKERTDEAMATLQDEGVSIESWFHFSLDGKDYLLCYMRAESIKKASEVVRSSPHAIDAYHQQFKKDTWVGGKSARLLVDLVNDRKQL
ncbi:MAG: hypothetical protein KME17_04000 [Cyanosarcina radialis HA8281-LM2]|jgi:hypothetical protein|nr:hypothetical protein [Cyanosarcina radialis HA8281-LM2]